jgi:serine/threonine-protein kinase
MSHAARPDMATVPGRSETIAGYRLDSCIGQGSAAAVYLARDERQGRRVALKVMVPELARDAGFRTRMIREARAAAALGHPHIIPAFEADEADGTLYVAMRYVRDGDARSLLGQVGPLPPGYAGQIIAQVASALDAAHARGLTHGDVRPANILLDGEVGDAATGDHAYLSDFGMSKVFTPGQVISADQAGGSLDYLAPEQIEGRPVDGRADLYSLACTGFELLCGAPPFGPDQGQTLVYAQIYADPPAVSARRAGLPAAVDSVLATALAKDPADRYPSCGRFAEELRAALGVRPGDRSAALRERTALLEERPAARPLPLGQGATDAARGADPDPSEPHRRALRLALAVAAVVVVIVAAVAGVALAKRSAPAQPTASSPASHSPSPSSTSVSAAPSPSEAELAAQQAAALGTLLTSSAAARKGLHQAVAQVGACANLPAAVSKLQDVVNQRSSEYGRASALATSALPDGARVKSALVAALASSLKADRDYLAWARQQQSSGCTPATQSSAYNAAFSTSQQADAAKQAFVRAWNPVAARYGIAPESPRAI